MQEITKVALDAMGGDNAPVEIVKGAVDAVSSRKDIKVFLVGQETIVKAELAKYSYKAEQIEVVHAPEVIEMAEPPVIAIRRKKQSSMVVAMNMVKHGEADAFVSLTGLDEENIIAGLFAKTKGVHKIIVKVNEDARAQMVRAMGVDSIVSAKSATADAIIGYVRARQNSYSSANVETMYRLVDDEVEALEFIIKEDAYYTNVALKDLPTKKNTLIACIARKRQIIIPSGNDMLQVGDSVVVVTRDKMVQDIRDILA